MSNNLRGVENLTDLDILLTNMPNLVQKGSLLNINQDNGVINRKLFEQALSDLRAALPEAIREANIIRHNEKTIIEGAHNYAKSTETEVQRNRQLIERALSKKQEEADNTVRQMLEQANRDRELAIQKAEEEARAIVNSAMQHAESIKQQANQEAENIVAMANAQAEKLVHESSIMENARQQADIFLQNAEYEIENNYIQANNLISALCDEMEDYLNQKIRSIRMVKTQINMVDKGQILPQSGYTQKTEEDFLNPYEEEYFEAGEQSGWAPPYEELNQERRNYPNNYNEEEDRPYYPTSYEPMR